MKKRTPVPHKLLWAKVLFVILSCIISQEICQSSDKFGPDVTDARKKRRLLTVTSPDDQYDQENDDPNDGDFIIKKYEALKNNPNKRIINQSNFIEKKFWEYLSNHLPPVKYKDFLGANLNFDDLRGYVLTHISTALLKRDHTFSEALLTPEEKEILQLASTPFTILQLNMYTAQQVCSPLRSRSSLKQSTYFPTPLLRLTVRRGCIEERSGKKRKPIRQPIFDTRQDLLKNRTQTLHDIDTYIRAVQAERARTMQEAKEQERIVGLTRAAAQHQLKCLQEGGTEQVFKNFLTWLEGQASSELTRSEINQYFITHMAFLFREIEVGGIRFFYNPLDIDASLRDSQERSNPERLLQGLNAIYETQEMNGSFKRQIFDWHHIAQEQLPQGSIVVCIPQEIHQNPLLHPFNAEGSQIDRQLFSMLKREANSHIAQAVAY